MEVPVQLQSPFAAAREFLRQSGVVTPVIPVRVADSISASIRTDLLGIGLDPGIEEVTLGVAGGLAIGLKIALMNDAPLQLLQDYVTLSQVFIETLGRDPAEVPRELADFIRSMGFDDPDASFTVNGDDEPEPGARPTPMWGLPAGRFQEWMRQAALPSAPISPRMGSWPQVGGPQFRRGADPIPEPPEPPVVETPEPRDDLKTRWW